MKDNEEGFSTAWALTVIFSLCVITLSFAMIVMANGKKINSYEKAAEARKETDSIIADIEKAIQNLKENSADSDVYEIAALIEGACKYDFTVKELSTGINKNFASEKLLENEELRQYMLLNEEEAVTQYGWINPSFSDDTVLQTVTKDFENTFPLVNRFPPLNIHFMSEAFVKAVLKYFNIKNADGKAELISQKLTGQTELKELADLLEIGESHSLFELVGFKSAFWEVCFDTENYGCRLVFAAVPEKENQKKIEKYILVEKDLTYKGGSL